MIRKLLKASATAITATAFTLASQAVSAERLSLSSWGSPKHFQVAEFVPVFKKLLKEKSDGEIRLKTFAGGEMVKQQFVSTAIPQGTVDISLTTLDNWSGRISDVGILSTPLWDKSMEWTYQNLRPGNKVFDYFDAQLQKEGAVLLAMFDIGPPVVTANFKIEGPESFKDMPIRALSKGTAEVLQVLGAAPTIMGVGDVYSGLQRGTVKGSMSGLGGAVGLKHYEVTSYMFVPNGVMGTILDAYVMNKDKFDSLSPKLQKAVMEAATEARDHMQKFAIDKMKSLIDQVRASGNVVTVVERNGELWNSFAKKLEPLTLAAKSTYSKEVQAALAED